MVTNWRLGRGQLVSRVPSARMTKTVETICGAHAQLASSVALSLAARVSGLKQRLVDAAMEDDRTLVKTWAMRGTLALDGRVLTREALAQMVVNITKRPHLVEGLSSAWGGLLKPAAARGLLCFGPQAAENWLRSRSGVPRDGSSRLTFEP